MTLSTSSSGGRQAEHTTQGPRPPAGVFSFSHSLKDPLPMKHLVWPLLQVGLMVAWFTVAPTLPWWVVFFPAMVSAAVVIFMLVCMGLALWAGIGKRFR